MREFFRTWRRKPGVIVISIIVLFLAGLSIKALLNSLFPSWVSPTVEVTVSFSDAKANLLVDPVLVTLEEAMNGVPNIRYMAFAATPFGTAGEAKILVIFQPGTDPKVAVLNVQNRIQKVKNRLAPMMETEGITVTQALASRLMYVSINSTYEDADQDFLCNYTAGHLSELEQVQGIGNATILGYRKSVIRFKLDLDRMSPWNLTASDALNAMIPSSMMGPSQPAFLETGRTSQAVEYVRTFGLIPRYENLEQFENIVLRASPDGDILRLKDIGEVECGTVYPSYPSHYNIDTDIDGHSSAVIFLKQLPGANPAEVIKEVRKKLEKWLFPFEISDEFPASWNLPQNPSRSGNR